LVAPSGATRSTPTRSAILRTSRAKPPSSYPQVGMEAPENAPAVGASRAARRTAASRQEATHGLLRMKQHHGSASGGGRLRAAIFGVNDGLVTNASLVVGVAAAEPGRQVVILAGIAGLVAGAFSMAAGEYISMSVQRELFESQIALERHELD